MEQQLAEPYLLRPPGQSRFVLLDRPIAHPGICRVCGASQKPVVEFGSSDDDGAIYFCVDCLTEVAKGVLDLVDASELNTARLTAKQAIAQRDRAGKLINEYIDRLNDLHRSLISDLHSLPISDVKEPEGIRDESATEQYDKVRDSVITESTVNQPISIEGPIGLSDGGLDGPGITNKFQF